GEAGAAYDAAAFDSRLNELGPPIATDYRLTWQYPPTMFLLVAPFALAPFALGAFAWSGGSALVFGAALRGAGVPWASILAIAASTSALQAFVTGQNGFMTAALLLGAALAPDRHPLVAGLCAAALSVKPQLGLLIPIAYAAAGCWRAFAVAALGAAALAGAATGVYGAAIWGDFAAGLGAVSDRVADGVYPLDKMATPFAFAKYAGLARPLAMAVHAGAALAAAGAVAIIWARVKAADLRAASLIAATFFVAPYAYYYDLILLAAPLAFLAVRAEREGWLAFERPAFAIIFFAPMAIGGGGADGGLAVGFVCVVLVAVCVLRRVRAGAPHAFRFAGQQSTGSG
ncbi:MAG: glycosyltransferase family 87 protein, partial [Pseudomonadota bacterium]